MKNPNMERQLVVDGVGEKKLEDLKQKRLSNPEKMIISKEYLRKLDTYPKKEIAITKPLEEVLEKQVADENRGELKGRTKEINGKIIGVDEKITAVTEKARIVIEGAVGWSSDSAQDLVSGSDKVVKEVVGYSMVDKRNEKQGNWKKKAAILGTFAAALLVTDAKAQARLASKASEVVGLTEKNAIVLDNTNQDSIRFSNAVDKYGNIKRVIDTVEFKKNNPDLLARLPILQDTVPKQKIEEEIKYKEANETITKQERQTVKSIEKRMDKKTKEFLAEMASYYRNADGVVFDSLNVYESLCFVWSQFGAPRIRLVKTPGVRSHSGGPFPIIWLEYLSIDNFFAELAHTHQFKKAPIKNSLQAMYTYGSAFTKALLKRDSLTFFLRWQDIYTKMAYQKGGYEFEAHGFEYVKNPVSGAWESKESIPNLSIDTQIKKIFEQRLLHSQ